MSQNGTTTAAAPEAVATSVKAVGDQFFSAGSPHKGFCGTIIEHHHFVEKWVLQLHPDRSKLPDADDARGWRRFENDANPISVDGTVDSRLNVRVQVYLSDIKLGHWQGNAAGDFVIKYTSPSLNAVIEFQWQDEKIKLNITTYLGENTPEGTFSNFDLGPRPDSVPTAGK